MQPQTTLKRKARHVDEISVTDCSRSHHFENFRWQTLAKISTWRHFCFSEKIKFINMTTWHESHNSYLGTYFCAENIGYRSCATFHERAYCRPILECFMDEFVQNLSSATKLWSHVYHIIKITRTVRVLLYDLFNCDFALANLADILQGYLTGAGAINITAQVPVGFGLAPSRRQAIAWTNADPVYWRIYAVLGDELKTGHLDYSHCGEMPN